MKKAIPYLLLLPLALIALFTQCNKVQIDSVDIPDNAFLTALIEEGVDTNGDGLISTEEARVVTILDVRKKNISDMTGIEVFVNLRRLNCNSNRLTNLDVSGCAILRFLWCQWNQLTSLEISKNYYLDELYCNNNQLTSLDIVYNLWLNELYCSNNQITSLDISNSNNARLKKLFCNDNQLSALDVSNNTALLWLECSNNQINTLDVSNNFMLQGISCSGNQLTTLDVSVCAALTVLSCGQNQLTSLDISSNTALGGVYLRDMPDLQQVCVWTLPFPPEDVEVDISGSTNLYFTTECSE